ncbi:RNA polymerase sigma-70 factor (ECF subfamily) [Streptosporangium lutulentum]|uniref:RNA polymerase sigma-70 factor (ECF subfamily) n=1 Tax=Streptosporangium lutulentum TaxID=1461250 RepID=A0ABT9Q8T2_9ACTN|nr:RNA polymerase sigma factor [Streptosporangium lutulentum]MDP9843162.1 RNA polymerase sigma-70 factor (ECF subfamily) [Streptosporangium lutulentum]
MDTDLELWSRAADGDGGAFGTLFDRHARSVYNHCFRRTANWSAAEDLTSVVFLEAWRRRRQVRISSDSLLPWLLGVANNALRNRSRSLRRHQAAIGRLPPLTSVIDPAEEVAGRIDDEQRMREILAVVNRLPRADQEVLTLCVWSGLSYEDAAVALNIPVGTVRSRLSRARARMKKLSGAELEPRSGHRRSERHTALRKREEL